MPKSPGHTRARVPRLRRSRTTSAIVPRTQCAAAGSTIHSGIFKGLPIGLAHGHLVWLTRPGDDLETAAMERVVVPVHERVPAPTLVRAGQPHLHLAHNHLRLVERIRHAPVIGEAL